MESLKTLMIFSTILSTILLIASSPAFSQEQHGDGTLTIPFELSRNHIIIPVTVDDSEPLKMILDTGMPMEGAVLIGGPRVDELRLESVGKAMVGGAGGGQTEADLATGITLGVAGLELTDQMVIVMPHDTTRSNVFEEHGVIGYSLFNRYVVRIDYVKHVITLIEPDKFTYEGSGQELPIKFRNNFALLECSVELIGGAKVPLELAVDTGASHALSLNVGSDDDIIIPDTAVEFILGRGISNSIYGNIGRIKSLQLGDITVKNAITSFQSGQSGASSCTSRNGNLGNDLLRRFVVTFDYAGERMILEPGGHFDTPFEFNMAGMAYVKTGGGNFRIDFILKDSPAGDSGLKVNDVVTSINGNPSEQLKIGDLDELLKKEGTRVDLHVTRGEKNLELSLKLRRLI